VKAKRDASDNVIRISAHIWLIRPPGGQQRTRARGETDRSFKSAAPV
jgi:hypothetical protein